MKEDNNSDIIMYSDGSCCPNPGVGGWAAILIKNGSEFVVSGCDANTTNNRMELLSIIIPLEKIRKPHNIKVYSDSAYVINTSGSIVDKIKGNKRFNMKNLDLWERMIKLMDFHKIEFIKVKAHSGDYYNTIVDKVARIKSQQIDKLLDSDESNIIQELSRELNGLDIIKLSDIKI